MPDIKTAFWNLQNLFDIQISDIAADFEYTPEHGWTEERLAQKIENLASIIKSLHNGEGPDLLGICEIENDELSEQLIDEVGRNDYRIVHAPSPDIRGIDVALIYSDDVLEQQGDAIPHLVHTRYPTRDILEVGFRVKENDAEIHVFVNHWPSRMRGGKFETEPLRIAVADYCGRLVDSYLKIERKEFLELPDSVLSLNKVNEFWNKNILLMGDFNDEPFDRSMLNYLQASRDLDHLEEIFDERDNVFENPENYLEKKAYLFNCMWNLLGQSDTGTYFFGDATNSMNMLDQFIVSRGLYYGEQKLKIDLNSIRIFTELMATSGKKRPRIFKKDTGQGFSDHFPIEGIINTL